MDNVKEFSKEKVVHFPEMEEMKLRLENVIYDYSGVSTAEVIGVIDIIKYRLLTGHEG